MTTNLDAFSRQRVSMATTQASFQHEYGRHPFIWSEYSTGAGAVFSHIGNESSIKLDTGTSNNTSRLVRQTKVYWRYFPGKSLSIKMTFGFGTETLTNGRKRVGYFDDQNGVFFQKDSTGNAFVLRSNKTGSVVDTPIYQSNWNKNTLLTSKLNAETYEDMSTILNTDDTQILVIDLQWLGVGRVRYGFNIDGETIWCHEEDNANEMLQVYMTTANLPARYELERLTATTTQYTMKCICTAIETDDGVTDDEFGLPFAIGNSVNSVTVPSTGYVPVLSVRAKDTVTFTGGTTKTYRGHIHLKQIILATKTNDIHWMLVYVPAGLSGTAPSARLTGASWQTYSAGHSGVEYDVVASALTGVQGTDWFPLKSGVVISGSGANRDAAARTLELALLLGKTYNGASPGDSDCMVILARALSGNASVNVDIQLEEQY